MADNTVTNGESADPAVEIAGDESSSKIPALNQKISDLERQNSTIMGEFKEYRQRIEELKDSVEELRTQNAELKKKADKTESEKKSLEAVAARAADLETEVSRLQHDLVSARTDLQEATAELSNLKKDVEAMKIKEKEKDVKLEAVEMEKGVLVTRVEKLTGMESSLRDELVGKEKEIQDLKKNVEALEAVVGSSKSMENLKNELEHTIEKMKSEISTLESSLDEKNKVISGFMNIGGKKGLKQWDWTVLGGSTFAAVAVIVVVCYVHGAKKC